MNDTELLVFARCAGFVFRAPGFSNPDVPPAFRAVFAFVLTPALAHACGAGARFGAGGLAFALASEVSIGAAIGTAASMLYDGAFAGGRALDDYIGIRASVPNANVQAGAGFGRLWSLAFATAFFTLGGYRIALAAFAEAFHSLPPGALVDRPSLATFALALPQTLLRAAILVAGPALVLAFVAQAALATVARVVPRLSTFALAFPVVFACVVLATIASLPVVLPAAATPWMNLTALRQAR